MSIDQYQYCPCGSGKKIKFCCGKKVLPEIEKIVRAIDGDQRFAALNHVNAALAKEGPLPCLYCLKIQAQVQLDQFEAARETAAEFSAKHPREISALAFNVLFAAPHDLADLVSRQQTLAELLVEVKTVNQHVVQAYESLISVAMEASSYMLARGCILWCTNLNGEQEDFQRLRQFERSDASMVFKGHPLATPLPSDAPGFDKMKELIELAAWGAWRKAAEGAEELAKTDPSKVALLNCARWYSYCEDPRAVAAWRKAADFAEFSHEEAVEFEAIAQLTAELHDEMSHRLDAVRVVYPITDMDRLNETLIASRRTTAESELPELERPVKALYSLLDREFTDGQELQADGLPVSLAQAVLYGKTTDKPACLELHLLRDHRYEAGLQALTEIAGDLLGAPEEPEVSSKLEERLAALNCIPYVPPSVSREQHAELLQQFDRRILFDYWPNYPMTLLQGKTPREAASDPANQRTLLAAILLLEFETETRVDLNELRRDLGLPERQEIGWSEDDSLLVRPVMLRLIAVDQPSTEALASLFQNAALMNDPIAVVRLGEEYLRRETPVETLPATVVHHIVASSSPPEARLEHLV